ncbi:hypothetical protein Pla175_42750 [Pirellulimonas nuda]|uniref:Uncharacterized protein n=1 Tax=Pirellulimonas nuda TaxID=2528009 RepID=A0A518DHE1_9BACT|nr:STN domain-containing protein [Pirellulimonas nuda]QDU90862.1 hypothetical protein Pla175_42750 [Pirellulimonas nuda]
MRCTARLWIVLGCLVSLPACAQFAGQDPFGSEAEAPKSLDEASPAEPGPKTGQLIETTCYWADADAEANQRIRQTLREPLKSSGFDFSEAALEHVVEFIRDEYDLEVQIDRRALDEYGVSADEPVTVNVRNTSLGSALRLMLQDLELDYTVRGGALVLTTEDESAAYLTTAVYPVADLLQPDPSRPDDSDFDSLIDTIVATVNSDSWAENGGSSSDIRALRPGALVISQTERGHELVQAFLKAARLGQRHAPSPLAAPSPRLTTRVYQLVSDQNPEPTSVAQQVLHMLPALVPEAFESREPDAAGRKPFMQAIQTRIVVLDYPSIQTQVADQLEALGMLVSRGGGQPFRGGGGGQF